MSLGDYDYDEKDDQPAPAKKRGFAAMDPAKQREIASRGGRKAHAIGKAHQFTSQEASVAGRLGGQAVAQDREHMSRIGRLGGKKRGELAKSKSTPKTVGARGYERTY